MRLAITQPNFLPWLGYFELLDHVDVWVSLDNVQLSRGSFVLRNRVRRPEGAVEWLSVSIPKKCPLQTSIRDAPISKNGWQERVVRKLQSYYQNAPFQERYGKRVAELLMSNIDARSVSDLNETIIHELSSWLGIEYEFHRASELVANLEGSPQDKVFSLLSHFDVDVYCNSAGGIEASLYDSAAFERQGVALQKQAYAHPSYTQHGGGFESYLSVVDLLFEAGDEALQIIRSGRHWEEVPALGVEVSS